MSTKEDYIIYYHRSPIALSIGLFGGLIVWYGICFILSLLIRPAHSEWFAMDSVLVWGYRAICLILVLETVRRYFNDLYVFSKYRIIHVSGRLSFQLLKTSIAYSDIRESELDQDIPGRLLNYGSVKFCTAGTDETEIYFRDIMQPRSLIKMAQRIIEAHRKLSTPKPGSSDGAIFRSKPAA